MNTDTFWQIIASVKNSNNVNLALRTALSTLDKNDIAQFDVLYTQELRKLWHWDNWAFAYVMCGCNSEYDFLDFCNWLILQGKENLAKFLANPDCLAEYEHIPVKNDLPAPYCDELDLIAGLLHEDITGEELPYHNVVNFAPQGKKFKNKPKLLMEQFPKLYAKFWQQK
ncbi:hypothetical protein PSECIP111854_03603 [Pseudoalteromonas sp. CIP111854]|uniref:DUF4240 domain-containing protein n=1 Tax=Pseudoalteromonas holothuriae TaxID=2963714 RepID=A0A9W4R3C7_9GAMM|nr:DUF4240 domain-containing protein [Pseudoalteromonas sp. CIP111854]CAH9065085.1 hypothetical protein PSECIP111854_03603 [Pseudoalteromonas sp. CIP111854]